MGQLSLQKTRFFVACYNFVEEIETEDLIIIGIGELYETYDKAKDHIFE